MTKEDPPGAQAWAFVDREKRLDRTLRRVAIGAWSVTVLLVIAFAVLIGIQASEMLSGAFSGQLPWIVVVGAIMPLFIVIGMFSVLVATLATVGIFLRLRTASLAEIQVRLAALEEMIAARGDDRP